ILNTQTLMKTDDPANKKARILTDTTAEHMKITTPVDTSESDLEKQSQTTNDWPDCWTYDQKNDFCLKNEWLCVCKMKLGYKPCRKVGTLGVEMKMGMKLSKEWTNNEITYSGKDRKQQLNSLWKKKLSTENLLHIKQMFFLTSLSHEKIITAKIFRTAYKVAKENQSFHHFKTEIDLQELNGVEMGCILHSTNACINIVNHISEEMRKTVVKEIVQSNNKISLIIDESTTISKKSYPHRICLRLRLFKKKLVSLVYDGAAVMLGCKSGVKKLLSEHFSSIIVWHCANHRLELSVCDAVKETSGINRFKSFIDKLYVIYHASAMNSRELHLCAELLGAELLKIGRILSTRWVSSRLMCVALQELSELSLDLQDHNMDLYKANKKIKILVQVFEERRQNFGPYYKCAVAAVRDLRFRGVLLHEKDSRKDPPIDPSTFYTKLKESIEKRLLDSKGDELAYWSRILDQKHWPEDVNTQLTFGEVEIRNLSIRLQLNEREMIRGFHEYILEKTYPEKLLHLIRTLNTIPISSSECERGFSQMNLIASPTRASLKTKTISALLFIKLVRPPLRCFDPSKYIEMWLLRG
uniref:HAT C-terminal dimerisation domain-containing protein n=1 Tax=Varanus komodoensis TaxID=61221 RepID=A0A8D2KSJ0_VARKO